MILEMAVLQVKPGLAGEFLEAFRTAEPIIAGADGHVSHELRHCVEDPDRFLLLVRWRTLEDHTQGFRGSSGYQRWKALLHHFYDPFPEVLHYELVAGGDEATSGADLLRRSLDHFNDPGSRESYFALYDPSCTLHGYAGVGPGIEGIKAFYRVIWSAFPDVRIRLDDVLERGDEVAARFTFTATHRGEFMGVPATGRPVEATGITILKFRDGLCVERWSEMNTLALLQQIGAIPG